MSTVSVSNLVLYLKSVLNEDANLHFLEVKGEISNFHRQFNSGHCYFTLKDEKAQIACVMFRSNADKLKFEPKNGDSVIVNASVSIFETSGQLQLYVTNIIKDGLGVLYQKYEELKNKLNNEGYFSLDHKIGISTQYPEKIAVLVGDKSAAMSDIKTCFKRRWPLCNVDYYPCLVQGDLAPQDIISKLLYVDSLNYDAIILARGGGSFEDLFCFNDETLVKTIYNLKSFIITGVGHEQDYTLVDFVADLRAPTPTATVELITPNIIDIKELIIDYHAELVSNINKFSDNYSQKLDYNFQKLLRYSEYLNNIKVKINSYVQRMNLCINSNIRIYSNNLLNLKNYLDLNKKNIVNNYKILLKRYCVLINAYSREKILNRGYSLSYINDVLIKTIDQISINDEINVKLKDGEILALVKEKYRG